MSGDPDNAPESAPEEAPAPADTPEEAPSSAPAPEDAQAPAAGAYHESEESPYAEEPELPEEGEPESGSKRGGLGNHFWILAVILVAAIGVWLVAHSRDDAPDPIGPDASTAPLNLQLELDTDGDKGSAPVLHYAVSCPGGESESNPTCGFIRALPPEAFAVETQPPEKACSEIYGGPQVLRITGEQDGKALALTRTRVNGCEIAAFDVWTPILQLAFPKLQLTTPAPPPETSGE